MTEHGIEIVNVKIVSTEKEKYQILAGNSLEPIVKMLKEFRSTIKAYEERGYTIISEDINTQSFIAEKKF